MKNPIRTLATFSLLLHCFAVCGCDQSPRDGGGQQQASLPAPAANESQMHEAATSECVFHVLKNVDRPFETILEPGCIHIDPTDPMFALCAMYCTHKINGRQTRSLFYVVLDNNVYPRFATKSDELKCVLVNRDGKVVFKDDDYWEGDTQEELLEAGAADSNGPPFAATALFEMAKIRKQYIVPQEQQLGP